jgi:hypothetical protein
MQGKEGYSILGRGKPFFNSKNRHGNLMKTKLLILFKFDENLCVRLDR